MKTSKVLIAVMLVFAILLAQFGVALAAPANEITLLSGKVKSITLKTDASTTVTTALVTLLDQKNKSQTVQLSVDTAKALGLITIDENGLPVINPNALGKTVQIDLATDVADDEADLHPVGDALATFFSEITDYETIMAAHSDGTGFGVIAQALWLTQKLKTAFETEYEPSELFQLILKAKESGDYSAFILEDGTMPKNWGQFRKAIMDGEKKGTLGIVMSNKDKADEDKGNNGVGQNNSNNANGNKDNSENKDKDKGKDKDK